MKRFLYKNLIEWKNKEGRKPLVIKGARQVGKTWLVKEFGRTEFAALVYINCDSNETVTIRRLFLPPYIVLGCLLQLMSDIISVEKVFSMDIKAFRNDVNAKNRGTLGSYFREDAIIRWHCTEEQFTVPEFIKANCDYPGSWRGELERVEEMDEYWADDGKCRLQ